jgi:hypothetical protein
VIAALRRLYYRILWLRDYNRLLSARVKVEEELWRCEKGQRPLPDAKQCADWARRLGVPT